MLHYSVMIMRCYAILECYILDRNVSLNKCVMMDNTAQNTKYDLHIMRMYNGAKPACMRRQQFDITTAGRVVRT